MSTSSVLSGVRCPVVSVAGTDPRLLAQFLGTTEFTVEQDGQPHLVRGCGRWHDAHVRFREQDEARSRDVRVWHVSELDGAFVAEQDATG